jgi:hypothetical protein
MPKPLKRFLHVYEAPLAIASTGIGTALLGAGIISAAGLLHAALIPATGGLSLLALPIGYGLAKATFWRKDRRSIAKKGKPLDNNDFKNTMDWDCYWTTVAVIGYERTGKTQLKNRLRKIGLLRSSTEPTLNMQIHLICVDSERKAYMALLDHAGTNESRSAPQLELIEIAATKARVIILVLDHADTEHEGRTAAVNDNRLKVQNDFINQSLILGVKNAIRAAEIRAADFPSRRHSEQKRRLRAIMVVMNKADVWEGTKDEAKVRQWTDEQTKTLKRELLRHELPLDVQPYFLSVEHQDHLGFADFREKLIRLCQTDDEQVSD